MLLNSWDLEVNWGYCVCLEGDIWAQMMTHQSWNSTTHASWPQKKGWVDNRGFPQGVGANERLPSGPAACPWLYSVIKGKAFHCSLKIFRRSLVYTLICKLWHYKNILKGVKMSKVTLFFKIRCICLWMNSDIFLAMSPLDALHVS